MGFGVLTRFLAPGPDGAPIADRPQLDATYRRLRASTLVTLTLGYGFYYVCRLGFAVVKQPLIDAGIYTSDQLGTIGALMLGAYAFGKLGNGFIADRVNVGRFIPLGLACSAVANLAMGFTSSFVVACVLWMINGWFQGVGGVASVRGLTQWFSTRERGRAYGIWSAAHSLGEFLNYVGTTTLVAVTSWRAAFIGPGVACLLAAIVALIFLKDRPEVYGLPEVHAWKREPFEEKSTSTRAAQLEVLKSPAIWICAIASALMYVTRYGINGWGMLYLQKERGYSLVEAGGLVGSSSVSGLLGSITYGFVSDVLFKGRRPPATLIFGIVEIAALLVIFHGPRSTPLLTAALFVYGFTLSGILAVLGGLFAVDLAPKRASGMAIGLVGFVSYVGAVVQEKLSGVLLDASTTTLADGTKQIDFTQPVRVWIGGSVLSMLLAATLWRVRPKR